MTIVWKDKKVAVLGLGIEGISSALFLAKKRAKVTLLDRNKELRIKNQELKGLELITGKEYLNNLAQYGIIVRSPGVKRNLKEILEAEKKGALITSQTKIFFDLCPCPIIGVTGTKGKGTTSSLIYKMLRAQGLDVYLGGNIGIPPLDFLNKLNPQSWVVLELSSFQLQDLTKSPADAKALAGKPHIAVILMVTSEHLDYHKNIQEYVDAKRNILRFQKVSDFAIINRDYLASNESDVHTEGKVFKISREREADEGCFIRNKEIWIRVRNKEKKLLDVEEIRLPGKHNWENVCASVMAALVAGVSMLNITKILKTFKGLEHRLELVTEIKGVKYYDDSFSTTPETAIAAIQAFKEPEVLILGGSSKNSDFTELGKIIFESKNIKAIIGIGEEWKRIKAQFKVQSSKFKIIEDCKNMREVVQAAFEISKPGDVVLLSPACASFGMFKNYKDRGEQFKREVMSLKFEARNPKSETNPNDKNSK